MRFHRGRPNPTENRRTFTPLRRATQKWPNSWKVTSTPRLTIIHHTEPRKLVMGVLVRGRGGRGLRGWLRGPPGRPRAAPPGTQRDAPAARPALLPPGRESTGNPRGPEGRLKPPPRWRR